MCVKLTYSDKTTKEYNPNLPVEVQLRNVRLATIRWKKEDTSVSLFLTDLVRAMQFNVLQPFDIEVDHGGSQKGLRARREAISITNKMAVCWLVKELVNQQQQFDRKLASISSEMKAMAKVG